MGLKYLLKIDSSGFWQQSSLRRWERTFITFISCY